MNMPQHSHSAVTSKKSSAKSNKSSTAKGSKGTGFSSAQSIGEEDRHDMIATAAYYRAEQRGFNGGFEMEDWLAAEAEIDGMLYH
jgi:hypothetical protein